MDANWLLLLIISLGPIHVCSERLGDVHPAQPYVFVNNSLVLTCTLKHGGYNGSTLFFEFNDTILEDHVTRIDNKTIQLKKTVQSVQEAGLYSCFVQTDEYVGSQDVQVEYAPHPVDNISCVVFNWDEGMLCDWNLGVYVNDQDVSVAVTYFTYTDHALRACPDTGRTYCYWNADNYRAAYAYAIIVTVTNLKTNISFPSPTYFALPKNIVQPAGVTAVQEIDKNTSCIDISWSHSKSKTRPLIYRIMMKSLENNSNNWQVVAENLPKTIEQFTVCHLLPFRHYVLAVDCKPTNKGFWSNQTVVEVTTAEDVPGGGPAVSVGSFMRQPPAYSCEHGLQNITLFWQDDFQKNGVISGYHIEYDGKMENITGDVTMYTISLLQCNTTHSVHIFAQTSVGISKTYSQIFVPQIDKAPRGPKRFRIAIGDAVKKNQNEHDVLAVWERTSVSVSSYTVYWCRGSQAVFCKDAIKWKTVGNVTTTLLPIHGNSADGYIYGISSEAGNISSGIAWKSCVIFKNSKPKLPPKDVKIVEFNNGPELTVSWSSGWCLTDERVAVQKYVVYYCQVSQCEDTMKHRSANPETNKVTVSNLKWDKNYSIRIQAVSAAGAGPLSSPVYGIPIKASEDFSISAWTSIIVVIIVVGLIVMAICLVYNKNKICGQINISYPKDRNKMFVNDRVNTPQSQPGSPDHLLQFDPQTVLDVSNTTQTTIVFNDTSSVVKDSGRGSVPSSQKTLNENGAIKREHTGANADDILQLVSTADGVTEIKLQTNSQVMCSEYRPQERFSASEHNTVSEYVTTAQVEATRDAQTNVSDKKKSNCKMKNPDCVTSQCLSNSDIYIDSPIFSCLTNHVGPAVTSAPPLELGGCEGCGDEGKNKFIAATCSSDSQSSAVLDSSTPATDTGGCSICEYVMAAEDPSVMLDTLNCDHHQTTGKSYHEDTRL